MLIAFPLAQAGVPQSALNGSAPTPTTSPATETPAAPAAPVTTGTATTAVTTQPGGAIATTQPRNDGILGSIGPLILPIGLVVLVYFFLMRGQRKEEKTRKSMIAEMKRGDEVILISGKFGKVVDIRDDRVVIKVDEANNVKETYLKSAVQRVVGDDDKK